MRIVTNWPAIPERWQAANGRSGSAVHARTLADLRDAAESQDSVYLVNCDPGLTMGVALANLRPGARRPLVASDMVLRRPEGLKGHLLHPLKRALLSRADLYINLFRDVRGLTEVFGIPAERCAFVPFKVNLTEAEMAASPVAEDYVLCFGRSMRDFDTFFAAMERLPWPGAIARARPADLAAHGARFTWNPDHLPANVLQLDDDGTPAAQARMLARAKLVVIPVLKSSIVASGISTALNAMRLGKCVIGSEGPGMSDVFASEALTVPAEDPAALAAMIDRAWRDDDLRHRTAAAGLAYAAAQGGEGDLAQRIVDMMAERIP
ncbi:glycosyl transferase family 1 [Azorhizobium sp. AG788]|uniref:glycosyltransferase n=1 Tax=Azorhizobium sp. AG788 TaxID=2183897 RepID=UPI001060496A|nr:glycosyltransferase [Azorhizobium sp. AG788]TDT91344.1 glycosyl transferase family 1 [Azorhizobium sp. AG788]